MKLNKIDEVWNGANLLLSEFSVCCHPEILLPWQRDIMTSPLSIYVAVNFLSQVIFCFSFVFGYGNVC